MARKRTLDAPPIDDPRDYVGRPSISPALATLVASGQLRPEHRVLDIGCGRGMDLVTLAGMGFRHIEGLDYNRASLRAAKAAERRRLGRSLIEWHWGNAASLADLPASRFDWAYDTFLVNNLDRDQESKYLRLVARVLRPGGRFLLQCKVKPHAWRDEEPSVRSRHFTAGPIVFTHFAEGTRGARRTHEPLVLVVLTKKG